MSLGSHYIQQYVLELSKTSLEHISNIKLYNRRDSMTFDYATIVSLEILETIRNDNNAK
ncbi:hypothetical protein [Brachyspira hyodysenteriae]|uniref:hypothetical protein n=1 Tax=Brachyspira hyodysenteriae TaxID=159 RepID=UPI0022CD5540|nr:hypothetical protein [Brachyspira hyodysenteriae]MCZ9966153.1 hypothetical protein [Brachyspira hyodysenteriae]